MGYGPPSQDGQWGAPPAQPPKKGTPMWLWALVIVLVVALIAAGAYFAMRGRGGSTPGSTSSAGGTSTSKTTSSSSPAPNPTDTSGIKRSTLQMQPGDCFDDQRMADSQYAYAWVVDCSVPHDSEVFFVGDVTATSYPSDDEWTADEKQLCHPAFQDYVGISFDDSVLDLGYVYPGEDEWNSGTHTLMCFAQDEAGGLTQSVKGSNR